MKPPKMGHGRGISIQPICEPPSPLGARKFDGDGDAHLDAYYRRRDVQLIEAAAMRLDSERNCEMN
jgi:hypothetical protein